jgi:hypothetical protein
MPWLLCYTAAKRGTEVKILTINYKHAGPGGTRSEA